MLSFDNNKAPFRVLIRIQIFIAKQGNGYKLRRQGMECKSSDSKLGNFGSLDECAAACKKTTGCNFFIYGFGTKSGACYWEFTEQNSCDEGWEEDLYDFYEMTGTIHSM